MKDEGLSDTVGRDVRSSKPAQASIIASYTPRTSATFSGRVPPSQTRSGRLSIARPPRTAGAGDRPAHTSRGCREPLTAARVRVPWKPASMRPKAANTPRRAQEVRNQSMAPWS